MWKWISAVHIRGYRFSRRNVIDAGSFGCIVRATKRKKSSKKGKKIQEKDHHYAIKMINISQSVKKQKYESIDAALEKIKREMHITNMMSHKNIVKIYDWGVVSTKTDVPICMDIVAYIVMEYIEGITLLDYVKRFYNSYTETTIKLYFLQILDAIEYVHDLGYAHRDLKLENIMISEKDKRIVLIDFGFSSETVHSQLLKTSCGSPMYAAPEIWMGQPYVGAMVDVWSLGIILYSLVYGRFPYDIGEHDLYTLSRTIVNQDIVLPIKVGYSMNLFHLLADILSKDVKKRIPISEIRKRTWITKDETEWKFYEDIKRRRKQQNSLHSSDSSYGESPRYCNWKRTSFANELRSITEESVYERYKKCEEQQNEKDEQYEQYEKQDDDSSSSTTKDWKKK